MSDGGRRIIRSLTAVAVSVMLVLPASACSRVTFIAPYDEQVDRSASDLQKRMDAFLTKLAEGQDPSAAGYDRHRDFYVEYGVDLRSLLIRAQSWPKNRLTETQLTLMAANLDQLKQAHADSPPSPEAVQTFRDLFNQGWRAVLTLELAKRRGASPPEE